jgi:1,4-alpha-glucan branching enzyme
MKAERAHTMAKITKKEKTASKTRKKAEFRLEAPDARSVFLAGDFNQWDMASHPLKRDKDGVWSIAFDLHPGEYQYRFFVDGEWRNDPRCESRVDNTFGSSNCVRVVS